jgi:hypothetical protein
MPGFRVAACVIALVSALFSGHVLAQQPRPGERWDPHLWSTQSNEKGIAAACEAYQNQYHSIVALHNASRSERDRRQYREQLDDIKDKISQYCGR